MRAQKIISIFFITLLAQSGIKADNPVKKDAISSNAKIATSWCLSSASGAFIGGLLLGPTLYQNMQSLDCGTKIGRRWLCATPMRLVRILCGADVFGHVMGLNRDNSYTSKLFKKFKKS